LLGTASTDQNTITGNQVNNNGGFGINISVIGSSSNIISSNIIEGNTSGQIQDLGTNTTLIGNIPTSGITTCVQTDGTINTTNTTASTSETTGALIVSGGVGISGSTYTNTLFINNESISGQRLLYAYDNTGGVSITGTAQGLVFDTSVIADTGLSINTGTGVITITDAGVYEVSYWVQLVSNGTTAGQRAPLQAQIETDPAGGTTFVAIAGTSSAAYMREQALNVIRYGCGKTIPLIIVAGTTLRISFLRPVGTTTAQTFAGESSIYIKRLRP